MSARRSLALVSATLLLAACTPAPGGLGIKATDVKNALDFAKKVSSAFGGQLAPPPILENEKLTPIFVNALNGQAPSLDDVKQVLALTSGLLTGQLPQLAGQSTFKMKARQGASAFGLLADSPLKVLGDEGDVEVGTGAVSPYLEQKATLSDPDAVASWVVFQAKPGTPDGLPASVDLRAKMPPIRDQGRRGTCVLFAVTGILDYLYANDPSMPIKHASPQFMDWLYHTELKTKVDDLKSSVWTDTGTYHELFYSLLHIEGNRKVHDWNPYVPPQQGYLAEEDCPYPKDMKVNPDDAQFTPDSDKASVARAWLGQALADKIAAKATFKSQGAYFFRIKTDAVSYEAALAGGQPIHILYPIYGDDWDASGLTPENRYEIPEMTEAKAKDKDRIGYHSVVIVGYERDAQAPGGGWFIVRNSWGTWWGEEGYCRISYAFTLNYGSSAHVATAYKKPFSATYSLTPPPDEPPPVEQVSPLPDDVTQGYDQTTRSKGTDIDQVAAPTPAPSVSTSPSASPSVQPSATPSAAPSASPSPHIIVI